MSSTNNNYISVHALAREISELSPEAKKKLVRRGRDAFNKQGSLQTDVLADMIADGVINMDNLEEA